jgi:ABC-type oligopeptide transport system ATPase subunit
MLLKLDKVTKEFRQSTGWGRPAKVFTALKDVSLSILEGESFGLVGESGSGKTTLTRCILRLEEITSGGIYFDGADLTKMSAPEVRALRSQIQIVFQDPYASLNPRMTVRDIVAEPMVVHRDVLKLSADKQTDRVMELLELVGLGAQHLYRFPHEFSGGQRQRIGIARALALNPRLLILDEPTSALDVSVQAQVLNLLDQLQQRMKLTYLFISHDLGVIRYICDRIALIYRGEIVEEGITADVFDNPQSEYARNLIAAVPEPDPDRSMFSTAPGP